MIKLPTLMSYVSSVTLFNKFANSMGVTVQAKDFKAVLENEAAEVIAAVNFTSVSLGLNAKTFKSWLEKRLNDWRNSTRGVS